MSGRLKIVDRASLKEAVLYHCADLIAHGREPYSRALQQRLPGHYRTTLTRLREELRAEGRLVWRPGAAEVWHAILHPQTETETEEVSA